MQKTIAAGGAGLLGLTAAGLGVAAPAAAAEVTTPCERAADQRITTGTLNTNWYMDCIPQYASALVAFTITSNTPFPDSFRLDSADTVSRSTNTTDGPAYFGGPSSAAGFSELILDDVAPREQAYNGIMSLAVASVAGGVPVPATCGAGPFDGVYTVQYAPTTVTFSQVIDGEEWRFDLTVAPEPLTLALNFDGSALDGSQPQCVVGGPGDLVAENSSSSDYTTIDNVADATLNPYFGSGKELPAVPRYVAPAPEPAKPALAATGVSPELPLGAAAILLGLGAGALVVARRRRAAR